MSACKSCRKSPIEVVQLENGQLVMALQCEVAVTWAMMAWKTGRKPVNLHQSSDLRICPKTASEQQVGMCRPTAQQASSSRQRGAGKGCKSRQPHEIELGSHALWSRYSSNAVSIFMA